MFSPEMIQDQEDQGQGVDPKEVVVIDTDGHVPTHGGVDLLLQ